MATTEVKRYNLASFHSEIVRECFPRETPVEEAMAIFAVLHSCKLRLRHPAILHHPSLTVLDPITTRDCADALAAVWTGVPGTPFTGEYFYWYWSTEWVGYARLEAITPSDVDVAVRVKAVLESHPVIAEVIPDDWNPFVPSPMTSSQ